MPADLINILLFFIFEFFVFFSGIRIVYLFTQNYKKNSNIEIILAGISISLIITSLVPTIFSFMQFNGIWQYLLFSLSIFLILHLGKKSNLINYKNFLYNVFKNIISNILDWKVLIIIGAALPFIVIVIAPTSLTDDLFTMNYTFDWMSNQETPYERAYRYVPLWEISFLPSMVITSTDNFLWLNSFKTLILIGLGTYLIGRTIGFPKYLTWISVFSSLLFFKFWYIETTLGTLKNDFIFAVGVILIIISLVKSAQEKLDRYSIVYLIMGCVFLTTKFSGVTLCIFAISFFIFLNRKIILKNKRNAIKWGSIAGLVLLGTTGHYYFSNFYEFGNPLYPVPISIGDIEFPGRVDWSDSSILSKIDNDELISKFFPISKISIGGILFPVILIFSYLGMGGIIIYGIFNFLTKKKLEKPIIILAIFLLITWIQYLITPFSASAPHGELEYLSYLQSTRYILGSIFVTELLFVGILWKLRIPLFAIYSFIIINAVSRYLILIDRLPNRFDISLIIFPILVIVSLFIIGKYVNKFSIKATTLIALVILIFIFSPQLVEENRIDQMRHWKNLVSEVHHLPSSEIFLIKEPDNYQIYPREYPIKGDKFQHTIIMGSRDELHSILNDKNEKENIPEYVTLLCRRNIECDPTYLSEFKFELEKNGFIEIANDTHGVLFKFET